MEKEELAHYVYTIQPKGEPHVQGKVWATTEDNAFNFAMSQLNPRYLQQHEEGECPILILGTIEMGIKTL